MSADSYLKVNEFCKQFSMGRSSFYRLLEEHPELKERGIVMRLPTGKRPYRIAAGAFEGWLREENGLGGNPGSRVV